MRTSTHDLEFRRRATTLPAALVLALTALGCTDAGPREAGLTPEREAALADTIATFHQSFGEAWSELEPEPYLEFVADDARFHFQQWYDRAAYEQLVRDLMEGYRSYPLATSDQSVEVLGPDAGVVTGTFHAEPVDTAGQSQSFDAAFTFVYERRAGSWKMVRGHESLLPPDEGS